KIEEERQRLAAQKEQELNEENQRKMLLFNQEQARKLAEEAQRQVQERVRQKEREEYQRAVQAAIKHEEQMKLLRSRSRKDIIKTELFRELKKISSKYASENDVVDICRAFGEIIREDKKRCDNY